MIEATLTIGAILTVALLIINAILVKATPAKGFTVYYLSFVSFGAGLILLLFATMLDRITIMGAGLGGWGIACLFAGGISLLVTAILDSFRQAV